VTVCENEGFFLSSHISRPIPHSFNNPAHLKYELAVPAPWRRRRDNQQMVQLARYTVRFASILFCYFGFVRESVGSHVGVGKKDMSGDVLFGEFESLPDASWA